MTTPTAAVGSRRRAVLLIANTADPYSRGLRVARSLADAGWDVEIAAVAGAGVPDQERAGSIVTRRYQPSGLLARWTSQPPPPRVPTRPLRVLVRLADKALKTIGWPLHARAWWRTLRRELPPADLYHAFGILTVGVALGLARDARRAGRQGLIVYDVIDAILDSNNYQHVPPRILDWYRRREAAWVRRVDAVVTVNDPIADHCRRLWPFRDRPTVLLNCQPRWEPPEIRPDLIREATGIPPGRKIVLFIGRLGRQRGLEAATEAVLRARDAAIVMLGFPVTRAWGAELAARCADPAYAGRHFVLPPVHPDQVRLWAASADVSIIAVPANSLNQRLSSPNKFWESLAAGTPVILGSDLEVMRAIVEADDLGAVADASDPADLERAIRSVVDLPATDLAAMRERCLAVCRERYNWETAVIPYLELVDRLVGGAARSAAPTVS